LKGKVAYMSPEQAMGGRIDQRADIFAMGIVLWELLARQRLMTGESAANTLHKLMNEPIPRLSQALPGVDPVLEHITARALEKDPQYRWQTASDMREALEEWLRQRPRQLRHEDVARKMQGLFANIREEVQRQVQKYMSAITAATNTMELQALTAESLRRMEQSGANVSGQLLRLNGSGSGSGVIPNYGMGSMNTGGHTGPPSAYARHGGGMGHPTHNTNSQSMPGPMSAAYGPPVAAPRTNNALLIIIAVGFFVLAGLLILVLGLRDRRNPVPDGAPTVATAVTPPAVDPSASGASTGAAGGGAGGPSSAITPPPETSSSAGTASVATTTATSTSSGRTPVKPAVTSTPVKPPVTHAAPPPPPPPEEKENGFLTINVYPWAKVSEGGKVLCAATPCNKVPLSPGSHTLTLENPDQNMRQNTTVVIKSGETTARAIGFK
ncbi:MAG: serine/threonine protein kinase, partial [Labilithrix sp.]|nr:serine/threonine protein kinase [Labilithrix sp.]